MDSYSVCRLPAHRSHLHPSSSSSSSSPPSSSPEPSPRPQSTRHRLRLDMDARTDAASRQKSCNICVRGKRRCDKRTPRCTRCAAKGLDCVYRRPRAGPSTSTSISTSISSASSASPAEDDLDALAGFDDASIPLDFAMPDFLAAPWDALPDPLAKLEMPALPDLVALGPCDDPFVDVDVEQVHDPRSRIGFIVREFSALHAGFAQRRATSFMHPRLWAGSLPSPVLLAYSAAAAYAGRTPETQGWALKTVQHAVREVYRDAETTASTAAAAAAAAVPTAAAAATGLSSAEAAVAERLARLQALVLLNTVRVFDGDVGSRAAAERELGVMVGWTKELLGLRSELEDGLPAAAVICRERPPRSWESWILLESTRRTIVMSFALKCLVSLLTTGKAPCYMWAGDWSFTASRHLWGAQTSVEFYRAWREKPQFCVTSLVFKEVWRSARPEDIDDFTRIMLTPQVGVDAMDTFMMRDATIAV